MESLFEVFVNTIGYFFDGSISKGQLLSRFLIIFILGIIFYKKFSIVQIFYNFLVNLLPFSKRNCVVFSTFTSRSANINSILKSYAEIGFKRYTIKKVKEFENSVELTFLQSFTGKITKKILVAKNKLKDDNSFVYIGFPNVPIAFLDGVNFGKFGDVILYEYQSADSDTLNKGFFELKKVYNTNIPIQTVVNFELDEHPEEVALKIEQSFKVKNEEIVTAVGDIPIISFGLECPSHSSIHNYAQVDLYTTKFRELLNLLRAYDVKKIHIFATTPVSLSFSLGRVIEPYDCEIVVYNRYKHRYNWGISIQDKKAIIVF